jgi:aryl-alcohol dehydrogenase-like predicted oxidoreductase
LERVVFIYEDSRPHSGAKSRERDKVGSLFRVEQVFRDSHRKQLSENGWLMARPTVTAPIANATNRAPLKELIGPTKLKLDEASMLVSNQASDWQKP